MPFLPFFTGIRHLAHVLTVPPTKARLLCATPAGLACRYLPSAVPWISEDRLFEMSDVALHGAFLNIRRNGVLTALFGCYVAGAT